MKTKTNTRKVLIISFYFPPAFNPGAVRMGKFAKYLPQFGWQPIVLTVNRISNPSEIMRLEMDESCIFKTPFFTLGDFGRSKSNNNSLADSKNNVHQVAQEDLWRKLILSPMKKLHSIYETPVINKLVFDPMGWYPYALKKGEEIMAHEKIDVILSTYNPTVPHLIASKFKRQTSIPWVADYRDLWSHNPYLKKTQPFQYVEERWEKRVMRNCDYFVSVSEPLAKDLEAFHSKKAEVIFNGFDEEDFKDIVPPTVKFTITYTGQIYSPTIDPTPLFEALAELKKEGTISPDNIEVRFFGKFLVHDPIALSKQYSLDGIVKTYGFIPFNESIKKQKESTILLLMVWNDPLAAGVVTSKIFEYMAAQKPVLAIGYHGGSLENLMRESGIGIVVNKASQVKEILTKWLGEFEQNGKIASYYDPNIGVIKGYTRKEETKKLAQIFDEVSRQI
jgi:glycosyltransferase involved in cell wall biosynthesis